MLCWMLSHSRQTAEIWAVVRITCQLCEIEADCDPAALQISDLQCNPGLHCSMQNAAVKVVQYQQSSQSWTQVDLTSCTSGLAFQFAYPSRTRSHRGLFAGTSHSRVSESYLEAALLHATFVSRQTHKRLNTQACHSALQGSGHRAHQLQNTSCGRSRVSCLEEWRGWAPLLCDSATA